MQNIQRTLKSLFCGRYLCILAAYKIENTEKDIEGFNKRLNIAFMVIDEIVHTIVMRILFLTFKYGMYSSLFIVLSKYNPIKTFKIAENAPI